MKKLSKLLSVLLVTITLSSCFLVGCNIKKAKKYDVTMKVVCSTGEEWIFTPDVEELHWEFEYDGIERTFFVDKYNLAKHPRWGEQWFEPSYNGHNVFHSYLGKVGQMYYEEDPLALYERGEYYYVAETDDTSVLFKFRSIILYVTIK